MIFVIADNYFQLVSADRKKWGTQQTTPQEDVSKGYYEGYPVHPIIITVWILSVLTKILTVLWKDTKSRKDIDPITNSSIQLTLKEMFVIWKRLRKLVEQLSVDSYKNNT